MTWNDTRNSVLRACGKELEPLGFQFSDSRTGFETKTSTDRKGVYINLVCTDRGNRSAKVWAGISNFVIEKMFHRTSGVAASQRAFYTTVNLGCADRWSLDNSHDHETAIDGILAFIKCEALPFLAKDYSLSDYSSLLNSPPFNRSRYHGNPQNRCHYGVIAAQLSGDPKLPDLIREYGTFLGENSRGFYLPRFQRCLADLAGGEPNQSSKPTLALVTPPARQEPRPH
jgi:hypothetical protein